MKIIELDQRSPEWHEFRRTRIGASDSAAIMGKSSYRTPKMVWDEKVRGESGWISRAMQHGIDNEDRVRKWLEKKNEFELFPLVATHDENDWQFASFDAINIEKEIFFEIKCPQRNTFFKVKDDKIPIEWKIQIQKQMYVSSYIFGNLAVLNPDDFSEIIVHRFERDDEMIEKIVAAEKKFYYQNMLTFLPPESESAQYEDRVDREWEKACEFYMESKNNFDEAESSLKNAKELLISLSNGKSCKGFGISTLKYEKKGLIDYQKIPELKSVDLELYRKDPSEQWRISFGES